MAYSTRGSGIWPDIKIKTFEPDNDENTLYVDPRGMNLKELLEQISKHFGNISLSELSITAEHIQTDCIGYDKYDSSDYTTYLCIQKESSK